jgi:hypothetical protein
VNVNVTQYTESVNGVSLPTDQSPGRVTVHGCTIRSPLTGCQVISRPRDRFSKYSKWTDVSDVPRIYITFVYNILLLNVFLRHNVLFVYTNKNILLIIGIILNVFHGPNEHMQVLECPFAVWSVISADHISPQYQDGYVVFTAYLTQLKPD